MINGRQKHSRTISSFAFILVLISILALSACEGRKYPRVHVKNVPQMGSEVVEIEGNVTNSDIQAYTIVDDNGDDILVRVRHELLMRAPHSDQRVLVRGVVMREPTGEVYLNELSYQPISADPSRLKVYAVFFLIFTVIIFMAVWLISAFRMRHRKALEKNADSQNDE